MSWEEKELEELTLYVKRGVSPKYVLENGIPIVNQRCIRENTINFDTARLSSKEKKITEVKFLQVGDTVINSTGVGTLGRTAYVKKLDQPSSADTHVTIVRPDKTIIDSKYLSFYLNAKEDVIENMGKGATGQTELSAKDLSRLNVFYPTSLQTQKRIADILSAYDDLIENNLKRIKVLEQAAQNIYKEWFVNLRFPGHENTPINEETGLPVGWEKQSAFNLFDIKGGTQPPKPEWADDLKDGYVRMVQIRDYKTDSHIAYVKDTQKLRRCDRQDVMIARYGASVGRICWGLKGAYNVALVKVVPYDNAYLEYIRWYVKSYYFQESLVSMTQRAAQDGFNKDTFKSLDAIIPTIKVVNDFHNMVYPMLKQMESLKNQNQKLKAARDILLPRLMNQTIKV